ncbi:MULTISPECIES: TetR/AcrR family transcriptional regulator [Phyllobacterium]|jgi:AcrR family transcriptional regulator|uniref:TetR/AcrR family transcriptional regulator n=1 Tax=Phyllobacterium sophorae TaxID=1520277 RepID=A0A2P7AQE2_9HYPH|nr:MULTISPECIES: TetR family transcriptional regulator [Phyllobacterium]PSH56441.1 TetR/AcrR family transcriptional regulator [Phyllobacterium sophorae]UXN63983.1 TetR family transcriptional regulator [Phyllobacterium sp. A18/5-2]
MANINLIRRAEIGREKRVKTRAQLVEAANVLFAGRAVESVTVDDVVQEAGVAKGTFYTHFDSLEALAAAVAEELVQSFDELLQPGRTALTEPALRIAFGCRAFIDKALNDSRWAAVVARMTATNPQSGDNIRRRLLEDLQHLSQEAPAAELNVEIVVGIMLHMLRVIGEDRLSSFDPDAVISAILRAIGLSAQQAGSVLKRLPAAGM